MLALGTAALQKMLQCVARYELTAHHGPARVLMLDHGLDGTTVPQRLTSARQHCPRAQVAATALQDTCVLSHAQNAHRRGVVREPQERILPVLLQRQGVHLSSSTQRGHDVWHGRTRRHATSCKCTCIMGSHCDVGSIGAPTLRNGPVWGTCPGQSREGGKRE